MAVLESDVRVDGIKSAIQQLGLREPSPGHPLISPKGHLQNWLIDLRSVFMHRQTLGHIAQEFWGRFESHSRFQLCGMETAGIPLLTALLLMAPPEHANINGFIVRKERKTTGQGNIIEGVISDEPIVFVDDIINSGSSAEKARVAIAARGHRIGEMFAVIDYHSRRGMHWRQKHNIEVSSLFYLTDFKQKLKADPPPYSCDYQELWHTAIEGGFPFHVVPKSTPLLIDGLIYRGCDAGKMHAFDASTGEIVWEYQATGVATRKGIWSSPAFHEGRIYFGAYNGCIYCLDAKTGEEIWAQSHGEWVGASPIIVPKHGLIYFGIEYERPWAKGSIGAFDLNDGQKVWELQTEAFQHGSPAYWESGDLIIWGTADHDMVALDAKSGEVHWVFPTRRSVKYSPAVSEEKGLVAFASYDKSIYLLNVGTGEKVGEWQTGEICYTTPLFVGNRLFCGSGDRHLYVIDIETKSVIKTFDLHARVYCSPTTIDGNVVVATTGGRVVEIDSESLTMVGEFWVPDAVTNAIASSVDGKTMFVSTYMNHLYAIGRTRRQPHDSVIDFRAQTINLNLGGLTTTALKNFERLMYGVELASIREEISGQSDAWYANTSRQEKIGVQRNTESIFLRAATRIDGVPLDDTHGSHPTNMADSFPSVMKFAYDFAEQCNRKLARVLLARLKPHSQVFRHVDGGEYYGMRDRYHLVIESPGGSRMTSGNEQVVMREGELWWFNNKEPHEAFNGSDHARVHLIFDLDPI